MVFLQDGRRDDPILLWLWVWHTLLKATKKKDSIKEANNKQDYENAIKIHPRPSKSVLKHSFKKKKKNELEGHKKRKSTDPLSKVISGRLFTCLPLRSKYLKNTVHVGPFSIQPKSICVAKNPHVVLQAQRR